MIHDMKKPTKWVCAQRRLRSAWASAQSDQSSLSAQWVAKDPTDIPAAVNIVSLHDPPLFINTLTYTFACCRRKCKHANWKLHVNVGICTLTDSNHDTRKKFQIARNKTWLSMGWLLDTDNNRPKAGYRPPSPPGGILYTMISWNCNI